MEVFHCELPADVAVPLYEGECDKAPAETKSCNKVISLWVSDA